MIDLLLRRSTGTLLPELYEIFGDKLTKLIAIFGGKTIEIPSIQQLDTVIQDVDIFNTLSGLRHKDLLQALEALRVKFGFETRGDVMDRWNAVRQELSLTGSRCIICGRTVTHRRTMTCNILACRHELERLRGRNG